MKLEPDTGPKKIRPDPPMIQVVSRERCKIVSMESDHPES
jgi:hypothetical protein